MHSPKNLSIPPPPPAAHTARYRERVRVDFGFGVASHPQVLRLLSRATCWSRVVATYPSSSSRLTPPCSNAIVCYQTTLAVSEEGIIEINPKNLYIPSLVIRREPGSRGGGRPLSMALTHSPYPNSSLRDCDALTFRDRDAKNLLAISCDMSSGSTVISSSDSSPFPIVSHCRSATCSNLCILPNGYRSQCEQKYVQKRLVTLDAVGDNIYTDTFWFPSCCVCTISSNAP